MATQFEKLVQSGAIKEPNEVSQQDQEAIDKLSDMEVQLLMLLRVRLVGGGADDPTMDDTGGCF